MRYHTFDLTVSATGAPHDYLLAAQTSGLGETHEPIKTQIDASAAPLADLLAQLAYHKILSTGLQQLGKKLYETLFAGEINLLINRALGETMGRDDLGLRLRLRINPPELATLPWEYLYSPERRLFLAASVETPLSRYLNLPEPVRQLACPEQINLLVVMPQNSGLDIVAEREMLETIAAKLRGKMNIDFLEGSATSAAIREALRQQEYHILHYAGHGAFNVAQASKPADASAADKMSALHLSEEAFIYLDHAEKFTEPMSAEQFAHFFTDYPFTRLVFLNACHGATRSAQQALVGLAPQLVWRGVPAVVAMQNKIDNDDAILLATEFYAELCNTREGGQVEAAISRARKALLQEKPSSAAFGNPVLYLRAEDGRLWEAQKTELLKPPSEEKKPVLERWQTWVALVGGILAIIVGLLELPPKIDALFHKETAKPAEIVTSYLRVFVVDSTSGAPLADVSLRVEELPVDTVLTATTTSSGGFHFDKIPAPLNSRARVYATKEGYRGKNEYTSLPGPLRFELEKIK